MWLSCVLKFSGPALVYAVTISVIIHTYQDMTLYTVIPWLTSDPANEFFG